MAIYNIPAAGPVSQEVDDLRTARTAFAYKRGQMHHMVQEQIALAEATHELLKTIEQLLDDDYVVPAQINASFSSTQGGAPESLPGTLPPSVMVHADKLQALANSYGYQISMHPKLTDHGRLCSHWQSPEQPCAWEESL